VLLDDATMLAKNGRFKNSKRVKGRTSTKGLETILSIREGVFVLRDGWPAGLFS